MLFRSGKLDDVRFYNRALSNAEVLQLYQGFDSTFSYVPQNGDIVTCVLTATGNCLTNNPDTSNAITMVVHPLPVNLGQATTNLSQGLAAFYPFNGNASDESGNNHPTSVNGALLTTDRFGQPNSAYNFDGINDYIALGQEIDIHSGNVFSVSVWIKSNELSLKSIIGTFPTIITPTNGWRLNLRSDHKIWFESGVWGSAVGPKGGNYETNTWNHIVGIRNANNYKLYQ